MLVIALRPQRGWEDRWRLSEQQRWRTLFQKHPESFEAAFREYNDSLRPFVEDVQAQAVNFGLEMFVPRSEDALQRRNAHFSVG